MLGLFRVFYISCFLRVLFLFRMLMYFFTFCMPEALPLWWFEGFSSVLLVSFARFFLVFGILLGCVSGRHLSFGLLVRWFLVTHPAVKSSRVTHPFGCLAHPG